MNLLTPNNDNTYTVDGVTFKVTGLDGDAPNIYVVLEHGDTAYDVTLRHTYGPYGQRAWMYLVYNPKTEKARWMTDEGASAARPFFTEGVWELPLYLSWEAHCNPKFAVYSEGVVKYELDS